ncbi:hypothetical protein HNR01_001739 [Methylorubrum rhodesianum]|uniref:DUF6197 family protein n=1 Tax=Methylorubrum rhodesianum TaxID=29427 RepID=UPI001622D739|nr:hypothetical protein [Methylorubrum rhodesianum]MBB5762119.1 hypothetical protein [Methylorubrum rhodesianum]
MASADILRAARARIEDPKNWLRGGLAADATGWAVQPWWGDAVCWCAVGAVRADRAQYDANDLEQAEATLRSASYELFSRPAPDTNDDLGHAAVMQMYDAAIAAAEAEAGR